MYYEFVSYLTLFPSSLLHFLLLAPGVTIYRAYCLTLWLLYEHTSAECARYVGGGGGPGHPPTESFEN